MRYVFRFGFALALGLALMAGCAGGEDGFPCTEQGIRDAIAEGGGPHFFACAGPKTVVTDAEIVIDRDVTLDGEGNLTIDGDNDHRVLSVRSGVTAELVELTVSGGSASGQDFPENTGGGIFNNGTLALTNSTVAENSAYNCNGIFNRGTLVLANSAVSNNSSDPEGGDGAGICNASASPPSAPVARPGGRLTLTNSTVSDNSGSLGGGIHNGLDATATVADSTISGNAANYGGGISNAGTLMVTNSVVSDNSARFDGGGIKIWTDGTLTLTNSTLSGNTADRGGGIHGFFGVLTNCTVSDNHAESSGGGLEGSFDIESSTITGNTAGGTGGGIAGTVTLIGSTVSGNSAGTDGGGISGDATLTNSTLSGNHAEARGGGIFSSGHVALTSSTISDNEAASGRSIFAYSAIPDLFTPEFVSSGSLIAGDCAQGEGNILWTSLGHNIESPGDTCGFDQPTDQVNVTAEQLALGPLQDNGGSTMTHALGAGSVAIDQIQAQDCVDADGEPLTTDQRGEPRPATGGTMCDVGAFEVQP